MNPDTHNDPSPSRTTAFILNFSKKALAWVLVYLMIPLGMGDIYAYAQPAPTPGPQYQDQAPPPPDEYDQGDQYDQGPPPQNYNVLSPDQLEKLVAPIALYPDSLVAQILAASTYPTEVADADHFLQANQGLPPDQLGDMVNSMDWDPSVKALIAFPSVLENLDRNLDWTSQLGNAYYNQPQDVMSSIQDMRQRAYEAGNLRSTQQLAVDYNPGDIVIAPANPEVVYVPWYDPWVVYGAPLSPWSGYYVRPRPAGFFFAGGLGLGFGIGIAVGHWNNYGWGYHNWGMGWRNRTVVYNQNIYISNSTRVVNHGYYGHFDRTPRARNYNRTLAVRYRNSPNYRLLRDRPNNNVRRAPNFNRNQPNRPDNNVRRAPGFNRNQPNQPDNNVRRAPNFNRNQPNRPDNNVRRAPGFNRNQPNTNRPNFNRPDTMNRPNSNARQAPNFNRPNTNRPNPNRPDSNMRRNPTFNRPQPQARPEAQPQTRPQAQPEARPQFRPQQRPEARPQFRPQQRPEARPQFRPQQRPQEQRQARPQQQQRQARPERQARPSDSNRGQSNRGREKKEGH